LRPHRVLTTGTIEWDLDSQVIQASAGGTVPLTFYNGPNFNDSTLTAVYNKAVSDNIVTILNISLQQCETAAHSDGSMASDDSIFQLAVAHGQTVSVATGDFGAFQCGVGILSVSYPATPYVVAVGGTTLSTTGTGGYTSETAWSGGGGGSSAFEAQPSWQTSFVGGTTRALPDIAFDADPNSGAQIILNGSLTTVGGTSLASPIFVGSFAKIQTHRSNVLGLPAAAFYASGISGAPTAFHDVTSGSNGNYTATTGWDRATGWGSFDSINMDWVLGSIPATIGADFTDLCPSVQVNWPPVTGATAYRLYEEQGTLPWVGAGTLVYTGSATTTLVSIPANINYLFKVSACNATVCSVFTSATASGKRPARCP
jgi:pseudomonalisin